MADTNDWPRKNEDAGLPVAPIWRTTFDAIVAAFIAGDWQLTSAPSCVKRVSMDLAKHLQENVAGYGEVSLAPLPSATWDSSVAMWSGTNWEVLIDLWTHEEGRSDLVLHAFVTESQDDYLFEVYLVYTP